MKEQDMHFVFPGVILASVICGTAWAQDCRSLSDSEKADALATHVFGGLPSDNTPLIRRGYVMEYDDRFRTPRWASWRAAAEYRVTPDRNLSRWGRFRPDPDIDNPVVGKDYRGLFRTADNFARGHIVPYFISGGDRDADGQRAADGNGAEIVDLDDACTVFEINYMSNIVPQRHKRFNGAGGLWHALETRIRTMIDKGHVFHIVAGPIYGEADVLMVGPDKDIGAPDMFFKIVIGQRGPVAFLFEHRRNITDDGAGCPLDANLADCIVPVEVIERETGLDFFTALPGTRELELESTDGATTWARLTALGL